MSADESIQESIEEGLEEGSAQSTEESADETVALNSSEIDLALLRAYEPVLRHTKGEMFFPCAIEGYLERSSLWVTQPERSPRRLADPGQVRVETLVDLAAAGPDADSSGGTTYLQFVQEPMPWSKYLAWRSSPDRPDFTAVGRWSRVGLFSRLVDAGFDIALTLRGVVPGGTTAVAAEQYRAIAEGKDVAKPTYYGRVVREGGWVALQYWFFYAMNDFRSSFFGVNDHEGDWEQIIVYLPRATVDDAAPQPPDVPPSWVTYAAHDLSGDDLRRRADDPGLELHEGRHPIVYVGAGSHASYFEPGEYVFSVSPQVLMRVSDGARRLRRIWHDALGQGQQRSDGGVEAIDDASMPWAIPFVDYARGDGRTIGPHQPLGWSPVLLDHTQQWVEYRGLWGLDTRDPLGGERAPAGPKFERDGSLRRSWNDILGFSGMNKVVPEPDLPRVLEERIDRLEQERVNVNERIEDLREQVRDHELDRMAVEAASASPAAAAPLARREEQVETELNALLERRGAVHESVRATREMLERTDSGARSVGPRAHIHHEHRPQPVLRHISWLAETWAALSGGLLMVVIAVLAFSNVPHPFVSIAVAIVIFLGIDAAMRGRGIGFLLNYTIAVAILGAVILLWLHWQVALLSLAAFVILSSLRGNVSELRALRAVRRRASQALRERKR